MQDPDYVDYLKFCDEVESIFTTKELEKRPLEDVVQFKPPEEWERNKLPVDQQNRFRACMERLSDKVTSLTSIENISVLILLFDTFTLPKQ